MGQRVEIRAVEPVVLPAVSDSNSPAFWLGSSFHLLQSTGESILSRGESQFSWRSSQQVAVPGGIDGPVWIESVWVDGDGTVFGWYHTERLVCGDQLSWPRIGASVSYDGGQSFYDLGMVLEAPGTPDCASSNGYFAGGHGDFTVLLDSGREYFYFYFGNYGGPAANQGIAVARLAFSDRWSPSGSVLKYYRGSFTEPGLRGRVTPVFPAAAAWNTEMTDSMWGPSLHFNHFLGQYVMLMTRSCCTSGWPAEGTYISLNADLGVPGGWSAPVKIIDDSESGWYPQVLGLEAGGTDRSAGQVSRIYIGGTSLWEMVFTNVEAESPAVTGLRR